MDNFFIFLLLLLLLLLVVVVVVVVVVVYLRYVVLSGTKPQQWKTHWRSLQQDPWHSSQQAIIMILKKLILSFSFESF